MPSVNHDACQSIISQIKAYIQKESPAKESELLAKFADRYFASCSIEDLRERPIQEWVAIVSSHWNFMKERAPKEKKIKIFNTNKAEDGWQAPHTIIQISHDDIPFLVDSIRMVLNRYHYEIHFIIHFGGLKVERNKKNQITDILALNDESKTATTSAPIYIEIDYINDPNLIEQLKQDINTVLCDVALSVADWRQMVDEVKECLNELEKNPPNVDAAELAESKDFLSWLINNNFTFLGARDYKLIGNDTNRALQLVPGSGLGVLRSDSSTAVSKSYAELPPQARKMALSKNILIIAKTNTKSSVHRDAYTDYIGVKRYNENSELIGERRFIGLYTSAAYNSSSRQIPFLRHKVEKVLEELGFPADSHDGKEALNLLETLPRDDLFQATPEELTELTLAILQLKERKRMRLLVRRDAYYRYFSCLVYVPRETFTTDLALAIQDVLMHVFKGLESTFTTYFSDSVLARIHYIIRVNPKVNVEYDVASIEKWLIAIARSWREELKDCMIERYGEGRGLANFAQYAKAFPASYTESYTPNEALDDLEVINSINQEQPLGMLLSNTYSGNTLGLKLFHADKSIVLSDVLPILENMGLKVIGEKPHELRFKDGRRVWINDFYMSYDTNKKIDLNDIKDIFQEAFDKVWFGYAENDGFNRLVLEANLTSQETTMLRAYAKYLRQIGFTLSQNYIEQALTNNPDITKALVQLFVQRFDAELHRRDYDGSKAIIAYIEQTLDGVKSLDEDRIIRRLLEVILATTRTNYFQVDEKGLNKPYISFKLDPAKISDLPLPRPKYEIFVYSPRVEGVHLRAGKVARGGLRWSDRREDFRTEVLGLMKAQQVKNTVIVPEGAKGGFVVKAASPTTLTRDQWQKEGIECYSIFISGLLDITDNILDGIIIPPVKVVRHDEDDPYLVVAADKGTATFSDIANSIAQKYGFWLDDAFASGGSAGYDHKRMGITSRGVWVSVQRHFREMGLNADKDNLTVIGIGDMSGDVFGNGLLMSQHLCLVAAYNHNHIFIDPTPNPEVSYEERKRLFNLPRSGWGDYNIELISKGGGIFDRSQKSIKLSPEIQTLLNTNKETMVPNELIRAILKARVDLLWNGGIGTFVKASTESHLEAGDRTNDGIRVNANELNARVIAEGGNLGMTQLARVEYSLQGGVVNTDFIDNSAGVDCSDHEVNIKILLNRIIADNAMNKAERNVLLEKMTDEVGHLVLFDNYEQTQIISLESLLIQQTMDLYRHFMNDMENAGRLDRALEYLPNDAMMVERRANNKFLTRPELAILLSYCKMYLKQDILGTQVPEDPYFNKYLLTAFPKPLVEKFLPQLEQHSLRREIVATQLCKSIVDKMGIGFIERLQRETGASTSVIVRAYSIAENIFDMESLWQEIISLDNKVPTDIQYGMMLQLSYLVRRSTRWFIRNKKANIDIQQTIDAFKPALSAIKQQLFQLLDDSGREVLETAHHYLMEKGVPDKLAFNVAACNTLFNVLDIIEAAHKYDLDLADTAKTYYQLGNKLELNLIRELMNSSSIVDQWDELARSGFRDDLDRVQRKLSARVLTMRVKDNGKTSSISARIDTWIKRHEFLIERWRKLLTDVKSTDPVGFVTFSVILRELFDFAQAS